MVKNPPANAGNIRDARSIPGSESSPGGGNGNPLQYSCLENPMGIMAESEEQLKSLSIRVKEKSEKPGLKLNIKKTKIMTSGLAAGNKRGL